MVRIWAMTSSPPSRMAASARAKLKRSPTRGSLAGPDPRARNLGMKPSAASAWSVRGAARIEPRALDSVAAHTPAKIAGGKKAISHMMVRLASSVSVSALAASQVGTAR